MNSSRYGTVGFLLALTLTWAHSAVGGTVASSLSSCQKKVEGSSTKFVATTTSAAGACLQAVASQKILMGSVDAAAPTCLKQLAKIEPARQKLSDNISSKCTIAAVSGLNFSNISGIGSPDVSEPINTKNLNSWCQNFGLGGPIGTVGDWITCITNSHECAAETAIAIQYPRAVEWLQAVRTPLANLPGVDALQQTNALAALDAIATAIGGGSQDTTKPHIQCGISSCGDGVKNLSEQCDGTDLGAATCLSLGFGGGPLGCTGTCSFDVSQCFIGSCGDGVKGSGEQCDGSDLGTPAATCQSFGFTGGTLGCTGTCSFNFFQCTGTIPFGTTVVTLVPSYQECLDSHTQDQATTQAACNPPVPNSPLKKTFGAARVVMQTMSASPPRAGFDIAISASISGVLKADGVTPYDGTLTLTGKTRATELSGCGDGTAPCTIMDLTATLPPDAITLYCNTTPGTCTSPPNTTAVGVYCAAHTCPPTWAFTGGTMETVNLEIHDANDNVFMVRGIGM